MGSCCKTFWKTGKRQLYTKGETITQDNTKTHYTQNRKHIKHKKTNVQRILHCVLNRISQKVANSLTSWENISLSLVTLPNNICLHIIIHSSISLSYFSCIFFLQHYISVSCIMFTFLHKTKQAICTKIYHKCTEQNRKSVVEYVLYFGSRRLCNSISDFTMSVCEYLMCNCSMPSCLAVHNVIRFHTQFIAWQQYTKWWIPSQI